jgi:hypothetical protein
MDAEKPSYYGGKKMDCTFTSCHDQAQHLIEWWGVNQHGERPEVADERYSCHRHILIASYHSAYGGAPDEIRDLQTDTPDIKLLASIGRELTEIELKHQSNRIWAAQKALDGQE